MNTRNGMTTPAMPRCSASKIIVEARYSAVRVGIWP